MAKGKSKKVIECPSRRETLYPAWLWFCACDKGEELVDERTYADEEWCRACVKVHDLFDRMP